MSQAVDQGSAWEDPRLPWRGRPGKRDLACWGAITLLGLYGFATLPLRPLILRMNLYALAAFSGSDIAMVGIGARLRLGHQPWWWLGLLAAAATSIKFDWIWWWAGRLWGRGIVGVVSGRSAWAARTAAVAERLSARFGAPAVFLVWFLPFLPSAIVYILVGEARMSLRRFLAIDALGALIYRGIWMYVGYQVGEPAERLVDAIAHYATWISIGLVVLVVAGALRRNRRVSSRRAADTPIAEAAAPADQPSD
ncbi:MAG: DedA family protein [Sciscionella sp.]